MAIALRPEFGEHITPGEAFAIMRALGNRGYGKLDQIKMSRALFDIGLVEAKSLVESDFDANAFEEALSKRATETDVVYVECINDSDLEDSITRGHRYRVIERPNPLSIRIIDDTGLSGNYHARRFRDL